MKETIYNNLLKNINITVARKINEQKAKIFNAIPFKENEKEVYVYCSEVNKKVEEDMPRKALDKSLTHGRLALPRQISRSAA